MLTTAQHRDAWSHIQVQWRFERVADCCAHTADQEQELHRRGSGSPHLHRASHGTQTLQAVGMHAEALTPTYSPYDSRTHIYTHTI